MKKHVVCLGCSLSEMWSKAFVTPKGKFYNQFDEHHTYTEGGGSNLHSLAGLNTKFYELYDQMENVTVVAQFTCMSRKNIVVDGYDDNLTHIAISNPITGSSEQFVSNTKSNIQFGFTYSSPEWVFSSLASTLALYSRAGASVVAFRGWQGVCKPSVWDKASNLMKSNGVNVYLGDYMTLAINHTKSLEDDWIDEFHPNRKASMPAIEQIYETFNK